MIEKFVEIVEDKAALELGLRVIMEVAETKVLPPVGVLPTFNDELIADVFNRRLSLWRGRSFLRTWATREESGSLQRRTKGKRKAATITGSRFFVKITCK